jgi:YidC/Oxa1 family membrane protein insertase
MFTTLIVQPIFNLLVLIYALLPGHNFGLALIIFTIVIRLLLWPLVKKQLHQARAMRKLQPELKQIKKDAKGDRQKESMMMMALYKERGINPLGTLPVLIVQLIVLIGLYSGLRRVIDDPHTLVTFAYPFMQHLPWLQTLADNIHHFDNTLFGVVNLGRSALNPGGGVYWPAMLIVLGSAIAQYYQAKQLMPSDPNGRKLRDILKSAGDGQQADQAEVNAAVGRSTRFLLPVMIFLFTVNIASALSLYWFTGGIVAFIQQAIVLRRDETELEALADGPSKNVAEIPEAEIVRNPKPKKSSKKANKRRKKR